MIRAKLIIALAAGSVLASACAEDRPVRTELFNENIYLNKSFLTRANPHHVNAETGARDDYGWLLGMTVVAQSVPTVISDIFPGLQSDYLQYVRFSFTHDSLEIIDGTTVGLYGDEENVGDPREATDLAPRVIQSYEGEHVDLQLQRNLDGEVTNYVEEFRERDWQERQRFKINLDDPAASDLTSLSWYYDYFTSDYMTLISTSLVPDSFHYVDTVARESNMPGVVDWARGDYMEWTVRQTYQVQPIWHLLTWATWTDTQTVEVKYSFWRRPDAPAGEEYVARLINEKDDYRRQFGIWDYIMHNFQDPNTGLIGTQMYMSRFNPRRALDYYMVDVPAEFSNHPELGDLYQSVADHTNRVFEEAGVATRITFHAADEGGIIRRPGDIRYSYVWWHNNDFNDIPWLGYGPSFMDPRTGEIVSATLNVNNIEGLHRYAYMMSDLLEETSDAFEEGAGSCSPGEIRPIIPEVVDAQLEGSTLFARMVSYMGSEPEEWVPEHDEDWYDYFHMLARDVRYFYPPYQTFVATPRDTMVSDMRQQRDDLIARDADFWDIMGNLDTPQSPTGFDDFTSPGAIEAGLDFIHRARESMTAHAEFEADRRMAAGMHAIDLADEQALMTSIQDAQQRCTAAGTWQTYEEWEYDARWRIAHQLSMHELGHTIGLMHNFYGSVDRPNYQPCTGCVSRETGASSSVMDYSQLIAESYVDLGFYPYDQAALTYAYRYDSQDAVNQETDAKIIEIVHPEWHNPAIDPPDEEGGPDGVIHLERAYLFGHDWHNPLSPLVEWNDLGTSPAEIVYNAIQLYDWNYQFRNFRAWRQYWETWTYPDYAFDNIFFLRRMFELWVLDWSAGDIENDLRLLGVEGDPLFFQNLKDEFNREMGAANRMAINFYRAILTQSNAERSYATTYDSYFGDVTRIGIIDDKFFAMLTFLGLWGADFYNWDVYAALAYYETNWGDDQAYSDAQSAVDEMLGGSYDVYPWFLPLAVLVFAQDTHDINFGDQAKREWIATRTFDRDDDLIEYFGFDPRTQCVLSDGILDDCPVAALGAEDDGHQTFHDADGSVWAYVYLDDRAQHVVANADLSPSSFQLLSDYNEAVNIDLREDVTTYDIKYVIDFYHYFN